jgi:excisionase family DNA binding protein
LPEFALLQEDHFREAIMRSAAVRSNLLVPEVREVMDIRQASNYLGISPDTLYKYASEGFVPAFKLGNRWRFKRSRLDEWMDRQSELHASGEIDAAKKKPVQREAASNL